MIFGLSRNLVFAAIAATAVAGGGLWYVLSEDEPGAPVVQQETVATDETVTQETVTQETVTEDATEEAVPEATAEAPEATEARESEPAADIEDQIDELFAQEPEDTSPATTPREDETARDVPAETDAPDTAEAPASDDAVAEPAGLAFDIIRVEPTGEAVIAGRGAPDSRVALLRDGAVHDETMSDATGNFVFIPEPFPVGTSDVTLRATGSDGNDQFSQQSLTIIVDADRQRQPMVARTIPGQPVEVLSRPEPEPAVVAEAVTADAPTAQERTDTAAAPPEPADGAQAMQERDSETPTEAASDAADETTETPVADSADETTGETAIASIDATSPQQEPADARTGVRIVAVEAETGGGLFVSGEAEADAAIRLYLNDTLVAQAEAEEDGDVSFAIQRGVRAGRYQVRLDDIDPATGTVLSRAEVGFTVPEAVAALPEPVPTEPTPSEPAPAESAPVAATQPAAEDRQEPSTEEAPVSMEAEEPTTEVTETPAAAPQPGEEPAAESDRAEATVTVPELATALVERGDSLWRISRQVYGRGIRYTEIFEANQDQIRNPDLIYPGQVFVLPPDQAPSEEVQAPPAQ